MEKTATDYQGCFGVLVLTASMEIGGPRVLALLPNGDALLRDDDQVYWRRHAPRAPRLVAGIAS